MRCGHIRRRAEIDGVVPVEREAHGVIGDRYRLSRERKKKKERKGPQVTFIHPQWKGANVHAKNDEGITPLDKMPDREKDQISLMLGTGKLSQRALQVKPVTCLQFLKPCMKNVACKAEQRRCDNVFGPIN